LDNKVLKTRPAAAVHAALAGLDLR